jgi:2-polyprenyl-3-methyl-5-hydroxy-6-metoxy-1,4-benzoquinol methylase
MDHQEIRTAPSPICGLCGNRGETLYTDLQDRLFGVSGSWDYKRCSDPACRLLWPDPMPIEEDIGKAYVNYYTHKSPVGSTRFKGPKLILKLIKRAYWAEKYGYPFDGPVQQKILGKMLNLVPLRQMQADEEVRFLDAMPGGQLLDVGCGSGDWLSLMHELGWQVRGVDFDERAVQVARGRGLEVACGTLEQGNYSDAIFDAVTLNHVIEHLPDPSSSMLECARILRQGGKIVVLTPNSASLGHRVFKGNWRGLEPPRHLHIFSFESIRAMLKKAGFKDIVIRPIIARSVIYESTLLSLRKKYFPSSSPRNLGAEMFARLFNILELFLIQRSPSASDCLAAVAVK